MFEIKPLQKASIPHALERVERYRLLNEPRVAESICHDILQVDPDNQQALIMLLLAITDQFGDTDGKTEKDALELVPRLQDEYARRYYAGIIHERQGKASLSHSRLDAHYHAYELLRTAMEWFEKAEPIHPPGNEDAILRWNSCVRLIQYHRLKPRPNDDFQTYLE